MNRLRKTLALISIWHLAAVYLTFLFIVLAIEFLTASFFISAGGVEPDSYGLLNIWLRKLDLEVLLWVLISVLITGLIPFLVLIAKPTPSTVPIANVLWGVLLAGLIVQNLSRKTQMLGVLVLLNKAKTEQVQSGNTPQLSSTPDGSRYYSEYITVLFEDDGYRVDEEFVSNDDVESLLRVLSRFRSNKIIMTSDEDITIGQHHAIGALLSAGGYEIYDIGKDGDLNQTIFVTEGQAVQE